MTSPSIPPSRAACSPRYNHSTLSATVATFVYLRPRVRAHRSQLLQDGRKKKDGLLVSLRISSKLHNPSESRFPCNSQPTTRGRGHVSVLVMNMEYLGLLID